MSMTPSEQDHRRIRSKMPLTQRRDPAGKDPVIQYEDVLTEFDQLMITLDPLTENPLAKYCPVFIEKLKHKGKGKRSWDPEAPLGTYKTDPVELQKSFDTIRQFALCRKTQMKTIIEGVNQDCFEQRDLEYLFVRISEFQNPGKLPWKNNKDTNSWDYHEKRRDICDYLTTMAERCDDILVRITYMELVQSNSSECGFLPMMPPNDFLEKYTGKAQRKGKSKGRGQP